MKDLKIETNMIIDPTLKLFVKINLVEMNTKSIGAIVTSNPFNELNPISSFHKEYSEDL